MWGRATLTMVASSTTISWAVRMTASSDGGVGDATRSAAGAERVETWTIDFDLSAGILKSKAEASST